jgi:hypothetical protein
MESVVVGTNSYIKGDNLPRRILDTAAYLLSQPNWREAAIIEHDTVVFKQIPSVLNEDGLHAHLAGYWVPGFKAKKYFHNAWVCNRGSWDLILKRGRQMIYEADYERGFPDYFLGWLCERFNIPTYDKTFYEYSQNTIQGPVALAQAREAYRAGCHVIHGIKNKATLDYIVS